MNDIKFPYVKNVKQTSLSDEITPLSNKEVRDFMKKIFNGIKEEFGVEVNIVGNTLPTRVLINKEYIKKEGY